MSEINFDIFEKSDVNSGKSAAVVELKDGRVFQKVSLKPNTNYNLSVFLKLKANDALCISGYALLGAFTTSENDIISGDYPTNRIDIDSTLLIQLSDLDESYNKFSFSFNSKDYNEALVGVFHCARATKNALYIDDFELTEENSNKNILLSPSFEEYGSWTYIDSSRKTIEEA